MAISTLLGGFRVWVPNEQGKPLHKGRASFFVAGTNTPATVYKDQGCTVPWGTQVSIDNQGYIGDSETGVWLKTDKLYKVVIEKKICSDPEEWAPLWKIDGAGFFDEESFGSEVSTINIVADYASLKALMPGKFDYVFVAGFYNPGDTGEPMCFRWVADKTVAEDNGAYVKPSAGGQGVWEQMFNSGEIDVRKFGAIPDVDQYVDSNILDAMNYAVEPRTVSVEGTIYQPKTILFSKAGKYKVAGSIDFTEFKMISAYNSLRAGIVVSEGVVFDAPGKTIKLGSGHIIKSATNIVSNGTNLSIEAKSMEFVRPQWFGLENTESSYNSAVSSGNNVFVYGDKYDNFYFNFSADVNIKNKLSINENTVITDDGSALLFNRHGTEIIKFSSYGFRFTGNASFTGNVDVKNVNGEDATFDSVDTDDLTCTNEATFAKATATLLNSAKHATFNSSVVNICAGDTFNGSTYGKVNLSVLQNNFKIFNGNDGSTVYWMKDIFPNAKHGDIVFLCLPYKVATGKMKVYPTNSKNMMLNLTEQRCHPFFVFESDNETSGNHNKFFIPMYDVGNS